MGKLPFSVRNQFGTNCCLHERICMYVCRSQDDFFSVYTRPTFKSLHAMYFKSLSCYSTFSSSRYKKNEDVFAAFQEIWCHLLLELRLTCYIDVSVNTLFTMYAIWQKAKDHNKQEYNIIYTLFKKRVYLLISLIFKR